MSDRNTPKVGAVGNHRSRSTPLRHVPASGSATSLLASTTAHKSTSQAIAQLDNPKATPNTTSKSLGSAAASGSTAHRLLRAATSRLPTASVSASGRTTGMMNAAARRLAAQAAAAPNTPECLLAARREGGGALDAQTPVAMRRNLMRANTADDLRPKNTASIAKEAKDTNTTTGADAATAANNNTGGGGGSGGQLSKMRVVVRVRPLNARELAQPGITTALTVRDNAVIVKGATAADTYLATNTYSYDRAFWGSNEEHPSYADQQQVFEETAMPLLDSAFEGYNGCLFAYGMTGSGKSYSMMGMDVDDNLIDRTSNAGIIPRFCQELFARIATMQPKYRVDVDVSYYEVYNEKIHDLLTVGGGGGSKTPAAAAAAAAASANSRPALRVREHPSYGPYVVDLSTYSVESHTDLRNWLAVGNSQRATAATELNDQSSRSHSIFNIGLTVADRRAESAAADSGGDGADDDSTAFVTRRSKISLVDLAGSERQGTAKTDGDRLNEGKNINKSLLNLGIVIASLAKKSSASAYVPYRDSVLTFLLKENLGGNSRTVMLATVSPASSHIDETLYTLRYASQARSIVSRVRVNEHKQDRCCRELRAEIERLQAQLDYERGTAEQRNSVPCAPLPPRKIIIETNVADEAEVLALREQLAELQTRCDLLQWSGNQLEFVRNPASACLVNLRATPQRGGVLMYLLNLGVTRVGRARPPAFQPQPDIAIDASTMALEHCCIENIRGDLFIQSLNSEFETLVNGDPVSSRTRLFNGDRVVLSERQVFRVFNPHCRHMHSEPADILQARHEALLHRENRLLHTLEQDSQLQKQLFDDRFDRLQRDRDILETQMAALAARRLEFDEMHQPAQLPASRVTSPDHDPNAIFAFCANLGRRPSDELVRRTESQVLLVRQRCAELLAAAGEEQRPERCYEFSVRSVPAGFGVQKLVVNIRDVRSGQVAEWTPSCVDVWLDWQRQQMSATADNMFAVFDMQWQQPDEYRRRCAESPVASPRGAAAPLVEAVAAAGGVATRRPVGGGNSMALRESTVGNRSAPADSAAQARLPFEQMTPAKRATGPPLLSPSSSESLSAAEEEEENWDPHAGSPSPPPPREGTAEAADRTSRRQWPRSPRIVRVQME